MNKRSCPWRVGAAIWRGLDRLRRVLHLLLLLFPAADRARQLVRRTRVRAEQGRTRDRAAGNARRSAFRRCAPARTRTRPRHPAPRDFAARRDRRAARRAQRRPDQGRRARPRRPDRRGPEQAPGGRERDRRVQGERQAGHGGRRRVSRATNTISRRKPTRSTCTRWAKCSSTATADSCPTTSRRSTSSTSTTTCGRSASTSPSSSRSRATTCRRRTRRRAREYLRRALGRVPDRCHGRAQAAWRCAAALRRDDAARC